jgi:hypothetical protein
MKTAVSIPDRRFERAALELGLIRSALDTRALRQFVKQHKTESIKAEFESVSSSNGLEPEVHQFARRAASFGLDQVQW